jgi:hypothetical protein
MNQNSPVLPVNITLRVFNSNITTDCPLCGKTFDTQVISPCLEDGQDVCDTCCAQKAPEAKADLGRTDTVGFELDIDRDYGQTPYDNGVWFSAEPLLSTLSFSQVLRLAKSPNGSPELLAFAKECAKTKPHLQCVFDYAEQHGRQLVCSFWVDPAGDTRERLAELFDKEGARSAVLQAVTMGQNRPDIEEPGDEGGDEHQRCVKCNSAIPIGRSCTGISAGRIASDMGGFEINDEDPWSLLCENCEDAFNAFLAQDKLLQQVNLLLAHLTQGVDFPELDDLVHEAASQIGTTVNNEGIESQLMFLVGQFGAKQVETLLKERSETG